MSFPGLLLLLTIMSLVDRSIVTIIVVLGGTTGAGKTVIGKGAHHNGAWYVQMRRSMTASAQHDAAQNGATAINFKPGSPITLSFAIWDGQAGDRDGKKQISIWQELVIE